MSKIAAAEQIYIRDRKALRVAFTRHSPHGNTDERWKKMAHVSLVLTFSLGLMAIVFWSIRRDFDLSWWLPNLYLIVYPIYFIKKLLEEKHE